MPCHADEERPVVAVIGRPPILAVCHQRGQISLQRLVIERVESRRIVEVFAIGIGGLAFLGQDVELRCLGPPVLVGAAQQRAHPAIAVERAAATHFTCLRVHGSLLSLETRMLFERDDRRMMEAS